MIQNYLCLFLFSEIRQNSFIFNSNGTRNCSHYNLFTYPALKRVRFLKTVDDIDNIHNTNY